MSSTIAAPRTSHFDYRFHSAPSTAASGPAPPGQLWALHSHRVRSTLVMPPPPPLPRPSSPVPLSSCPRIPPLTRRSERVSLRRAPATALSCLAGPCHRSTMSGVKCSRKPSERGRGREREGPCTALMFVDLTGSADGAVYLYDLLDGQVLVCDRRQVNPILISAPLNSILSYLSMTTSSWRNALTSITISAAMCRGILSCPG